jgi:hypothetical protein
VTNSPKLQHNNTEKVGNNIAYIHTTHPKENSNDILSEYEKQVLENQHRRMLKFQDIFN